MADLRDLINAVNVRLKHVSVLTSEIAKANVPSKASSSFKSGENINTTLQKKDFLSRQAQIVNQWITDTKLVEGVQGVTSGAHKNLKVMIGNYDTLYDNEDEGRIIVPS